MSVIITTQKAEIFFQLGQKIPKIPSQQIKRTGDMTQVVEHLRSNNKAPNSTPGPPKWYFLNAFLVSGLGYNSVVQPVLTIASMHGGRGESFN
jgi:hypothetical protein